METIKLLLVSSVLTADRPQGLVLVKLFIIIIGYSFQVAYQCYILWRMLKKSEPLHLTFQIYGSGPEVLLAFHGYGQDRRVYEDFATALANRYTVYSFDLLLHGESSGSSAQPPISVETWREVIRSFLKQHNIAKFSLVGYSLGARFALTLVEVMAERIDELILIAPDGIKSSRWYSLASSTWLGNRLLRFTVVRPYPFFWVLAKAHRLGLIEKSVLKFVKSHMDTRTKRLRVFMRWSAFRRIQPNLRQVKLACNAHGVEVIIFLGEHDAVVKKIAIASFHKSLNNSCLHYLPCGHAALISEVCRYYTGNQ